MISPNFATLLVFVQTDALLAPETADLLLGVTVKRSFERVSVDGQLSPSDTVILQCSGESGVRIEQETPDELRFGETLDATLAATRAARRQRRRGRPPRRSGGRARGRHRGGATASPEQSPTPRWSRPRCTAATRTGAGSPRPSGMALPSMAPLELDITIEGVQVCAHGSYVPHDADALKHAVQQAEVEYEIGLPGEGAETELFFSDLGHEYVTINADYTT